MTTRRTHGSIISRPERRVDWQSFDTILTRHRIKYLYHFTDLKNVRSIIENGGLFSWAYCSQNDIAISNPGGTHLSRRLDARKGLEDYVRLNFNSDSPMLHAAEHLKYVAILEIDSSVIFWKETKFSTENATSNSAEIGDDLEVFEHIDFDIATSEGWQGYGNLRSKQAEVIVKTHIPISLITVSLFGWKVHPQEVDHIPLVNLAPYIE